MISLQDLFFVEKIKVDIIKVEMFVSVASRYLIHRYR